MTPEKEKELVKKTPNLFYSEDECRSQLPINLFGVECDDGWFDLISDTLEKISNIASSKEYETKVDQIKEKYGTLRIYLNLETEEMSKIINEAVQKSEKTCESCGNPGKLRQRNRWFYTSCNKCDLK